MIFYCPTCQGENNLPISSVPPGGLRTTCRHCQQSLHLNENGQITLLGGSAAGYATQPPRPNPDLEGLELELPQEDPFAQDLSADQELIDPYGNLDHLGLPDISGLPSAPPPLDDPFGNFAAQPNTYTAKASRPAPPAKAGRPAPAPTNDDPLADLYGELDKLDQQHAPPSQQEMRYHLRRGSGRTFGPFPVSQIRHMLQHGELNGSEQLSNDGQFWSPMPDWPEFQDLQTAQPAEQWEMNSPSYAAPPQTPTSKQHGSLQGPRPAASFARPAVSDNLSYSPPPDATPSYRPPENELPDHNPQRHKKHVHSALKTGENKKSSKGLLLVGLLFGVILLVGGTVVFLLPQGNNEIHPDIQIDLYRPFVTDGYAFYERNLLAKLSLDQRRYPNHPQLPLLNSLTYAMLLEHHPDKSLEAQLKSNHARLASPQPDAPLSPDRLWLNAMIALSANQTSPAQQWLQKLQQREPKHPAIPYLQGKIFYLQKQYNKSMATMQKLTQTNKQYARALYILGLSHAARKQFPQAFQAFYDATLVSDQAPHLPSFLQLFEIEEHLPKESKRYESLWRESEKAFKVRNRQLLAHYTFLRAQRARSQERLTEAYTLLVQAIQLDGENPRYKNQELPYLFATRQYPKIAKKLEPLVAPPRRDIQRDVALFYMRTLYHTREWVEGKRIAQHLVTLYPKDANLLFWSGLFEEGNKSYLLAFQAFSKALTLDPKHTASFFGQLRSAYKSGQTDLVQSLREKIPSYPIQSVDDRMALVRWLLLEKQFEEAAKHVQQALKELPGDELLHKQAGQIALEMREPAKAQHHFQQALKIFPEDKPSLLGLAKTLEQQGHLTTALQNYEKYLDLVRREDAEALFRTGRIFFSLKKYEEAEQRLERAINFNEKLAPAYYYLARTLEELKRSDHEKIQRNYEQAIQLDPHERSYQYRLASLFYKRQKLPQALQIYNKLLNIKGQSKPQKAEIFMARANLYAEVRDWKRALQDYQRATKMDPQLTKLHALIGDTYVQLKQFAPAIRAYTQSLRFLRGIERAEVYAKMGDMYRDQGTLPRASFYYNQALRSDPKMFDVYRRLAYTLKDQRQWRSCVNAFNKFLQLAPEDNPDRKEARIDARGCHNAIFEK
ncbi:tetratricopeptide repeat protein [Myxococcota bacterium]|nr:tetratricopeptide repeat protein [Myxococcota bacterium]